MTRSCQYPCCGQRTSKKPRLPTLTPHVQTTGREENRRFSTASPRAERPAAPSKSFQCGRSLAVTILHTTPRTVTASTRGQKSPRQTVS
ncbi:uncharacterized protein A1O9_06911 [Exophiala aquamarina CBS 119918]|uniref:Uncharacterized protein n=1 Tax=Exophiala aquamarina CBS 119918 TaxID=1182545 RepID=A0A072PA41_9EURO|nr:uncharacterized protein A1O9_06911 [Exophiala aquamarina CBS 119918]KEF56721.1 hypothetical protein A1O9_06911 [Exophiala aquamarina CBS 119918]